MKRFQQFITERVQLFHKDIGIPKVLYGPQPGLPLRYGPHARQAALNDRTGVIKGGPKSLPDNFSLIEVEVTDGRETKWVVRLPMTDDADRDLVLVVVPDGFVKTLWGNFKSDKHSTLKRHIYNKPEHFNEAFGFDKETGMPWEHESTNPPGFNAMLKQAHREKFDAGDRAWDNATNHADKGNAAEDSMVADEIYHSSTDPREKAEAKRTLDYYAEAGKKERAAQDAVWAKWLPKLKAAWMADAENKRIYDKFKAKGWIQEHIVKHGDGYRLLSRKGKNLGDFDTKAQAAKHEGEVEYFKSKG